jgi:hypothetical protein
MDQPRISVKEHADGFPEPRQYYETTLLVEVDGTDVPVTFASVPARSLSEQDLTELGTLVGLAGFVGGEAGDAIVLSTVAQMTTAVGLMIDPQLRHPDRGGPHPVWSEFKHLVGDPFVERPSRLTPPWWRHPGQQDASPIPAAEYLLLRASIPAEKSDLSGHTLATIAGGSGGTALVVAVLAGAATPWLLVAVPAGVIVMKVVDGTGDALRDVVKYKIIKHLAPELLDRDKNA